MPTKPDWTFINTFAGWLSAVGTLLAVIVSLYLSRRDSRIRLHVNVGIRKIFIGTGKHVVKNAPDFIVIAVTNVGRRTANVTGLFWKNWLIRRQYLYQIPGEAPLSAQIPAKLGDGDEADFTVSLEAFAATNDPGEFARRCLPRPRILTARFLRMQVRTSTRHTFSVAIEKELRQRLVQWVKEKRPSSPPAEAP
ncbi:hypothetical protein [Candidatus Binatus sp.]|uniref:hypothetical protein n=1 Tax=Candidatus Binatus sp. TaxID=2811406 RepID=UPI002F95BBFD